MVANNGYTPTQRRILDVLSDGLEHPRDELFKCLDDELTSPKTLTIHVVYLREKLRPIGQDILCRQGRYRHIRLVGIAD